MVILTLFWYKDEHVIINNVDRRNKFEAIITIYKCMGDVTSVECLLLRTEKESVNSHDVILFTPLHQACALKNREIIINIFQDFICFVHHFKHNMSLSCSSGVILLDEMKFKLDLAVLTVFPEFVAFFLYSRAHSSHQN